MSRQLVTMKASIQVSIGATLLLGCLTRASVEETTMCGKSKYAEMKKMAGECWKLAYLNFLEEKLAHVEDFEARCNFLNYKVSCSPCGHFLYIF